MFGVGVIRINTA